VPRIKKAGTDKKKEATGQSSSDRPGAKTKRRILGKVKNVEPENLVFLDEMGVLLGLTRN